jgi:hypothetical protein
LRTLTWTLFTFFFVTSAALAQDAGKPWIPLFHSKPVIITSDFCDTCFCCTTKPSFSFAQDLPSIYGTTTFPPVMKKGLASSVGELQYSTKSVSPNAMNDIAAAASLRSLVDLCNICKCCTESSDAITVGPAASAKALAEFHVYKK